MLEIDKNGNRRWFNEKGQLHREDGPAVECSDGDKEWWIDGNKHRIDGPAVEGFDGTKCWYVNGLRHRIYGPAMEWNDGSGAWYVNGIQYTEEEYKKKVGGIC